MKLVRVLVSLFCATEEELGYDHRITLLPDGSFLYEFQAEGDTGYLESGQLDTIPVPKAVYYRTTEPLVGGRAFCVAGRTTRIFKGKQVVSKEDPSPVQGAKDVVVKDGWIGVDSPTEFQNQKQLFGDIEKLATDFPGGWKTHPILEEFHEEDLSELASLLSGERYKDLFLCVARESVGEGSKPVHPDAWESKDVFTLDDPIQEGSHNITNERMNPSVMVTAATRPRAPEQYDAFGIKLPSLRQTFSPKKRCFFVFNDICTRVSSLPTLGDAMSVLRQTYLGKWLLCSFIRDYSGLTFIYQPLFSCSVLDGSTAISVLEISWRQREMAESHGRQNSPTWSTHGSFHPMTLATLTVRL